MAVEFIVAGIVVFSIFLAICLGKALKILSEDPFLEENNPESSE